MDNRFQRKRKGMNSNGLIPSHGYTPLAQPTVATTVCWSVAAVMSYNIREYRGR
jgi:hypothetical protein